MGILTTILLAVNGSGRGEQDPGGGTSALLIVAVIVGVVLAMALLFMLFHRMGRASRGGVQPRSDEFRERGNPPFESVARKR